MTVHGMDTDDPNSPMTTTDDAVLTGAEETGVEVDMATLWVTSTPDRPEDGEEGTSS